MKKVFAYIFWGIISLPFLAIVRNISRGHFPEYSFLIVGIASGLVVYAFLLVKRYKPQKATTRRIEARRDDVGYVVAQVKAKKSTIQKGLDANKTCLNCGFDRTPTDVECPKCGAIYEKLDMIMKNKLQERIIPTPEKRVEAVEKPPKRLSGFFDTIKENKQKAVLFVTAGILVLMFLFPPFHVVWKKGVIRIGYAFLFTSPSQYKYAKVDAVLLLVQSLIVAGIGVLLWFAFRKNKEKRTKKGGSSE